MIEVTNQLIGLREIAKARDDAARSAEQLRAAEKTVYKHGNSMDDISNTYQTSLEIMVKGIAKDKEEVAAFLRRVLPCSCDSIIIKGEIISLPPKCNNCETTKLLLEYAYPTNTQLYEVLEEKK